MTSRKTVLSKAQQTYERYLNLLDMYAMLTASDRKLYEKYLDNRGEFSLISSDDPAARRDTKIARYRQENELKLKLEVRRGFTELHVHAYIVGSSSQKSLSNSKVMTPLYEKSTLPKYNSVSIARFTISIKLLRS